MDRGTNAKRMIEGKDVGLRLGFIGIKNRSQQDIIDRIPVKTAIEKEQLYFSTHPVYSSMPQGLLGIGNLTNKLTKILFTHIKHCLPEITMEIKAKVKETEDDLRDLGPPMPHEEGHKTQLLWNMINDFISTYKNMISGRFDSKRVMAPGQKQELSGGARIKMSFYNLYSDLEGFRACSDYNDMHIQKAIQMHEGDGLPGFPSVDVFIYLVTPQIDKLRDPALELIQETYAQLEQLASGIVNKIFQRFPSMIPEIMDIIVKTLSKEREKTREVVEAIIDSEAFHFTNDVNYKENRADIVASDGPQGQDMGRSPSMANQPNMGRGANAFVMEMRKRIDQYFDIVLRNIRDSVPKAIGCFLVKKSQEVLQFELYNQVNSNPHLAQALGEPARITERRNALTAVLKTLKNSLKVLQRDPDISANTIGDEELEATLR